MSKGHAQLEVHSSPSNRFAGWIAVAAGVGVAARNLGTDAILSLAGLLVSAIGALFLWHTRRPLLELNGDQLVIRERLRPGTRVVSVGEIEAWIYQPHLERMEIELRSKRRLYLDTRHFSESDKTDLMSWVRRNFDGATNG